MPTVFATLLGMQHARTYDSVRCLTNAAAGLPPAFHDGIQRLFPNARLYRMYGQTECVRVSFLEPELIEAKPTSVGRAIPGTEAFVLDEAGRPVAPGETGVLHVRGPHLMTGYWGDPALTDEWLKTGPSPGERMLCTHDHFTVDEEGLLYFVGRTDDIVKTRGREGEHDRGREPATRPQRRFRRLRSWASPMTSSVRRCGPTSCSSRARR